MLPCEITSTANNFHFVKLKPKYIEGLLKSAAARKREYERTVERQVQKEREKEQGEFDDKEAFVTEAYPLKFELIISYS